MFSKPKWKESKFSQLIRLASVATTEAMVNIMKGMGDLMGKATDSINVNNVQKVIEDFNMKLEQQQGVNEMLDDAFDQDDEIIDDDVYLLESQSVFRRCSCQTAKG